MPIELEFKKSTVALAGNPFGKKIFLEQVAPKINRINDPATIIFPDQISFITSSFVQGFFDNWLHAMSTDEIRKKITIESSNQRVKDYIWANLE